MADRLTQLQDAIDQLANQFVASLSYINKHHSPQRLGSTDVVRQESNGEGFYKQAQPQVDSLPSDVFKAAQLELAQDLILKEQEIEALVSMLPGLENSEKFQEQTIRQLEKELRAADLEIKEAFELKEELVERLGVAIQSIKRP
ncbi:mediator of RNA polymerase II transcription subunit 21 [Blumeria hordei DH14]|uniref:Mediator of RNA polymerase II transcription subunit 21 n=1 Tax=Blumeria graminis f. sp. hordei (strain DH14) TaxID=546991 RepID=N1JA05_BLUG1|nr:mediator of RNA polymerase II transcription subunit 21 [Blumeria hordei DH14]